ncbi:probable L-type lectin-domain containing receptor kinase S.5 [Cucurbita pepo subsp. pepo]|uniref:probable L-type lectin-domain containing receptor kinase S.5 n=1 Tax=Cucurbita pepo subsp. pepo TaxID=3664 RepID=UPI000C9D33A1|nr:probable L-type lectin-domain containing receptor kinase S.5 [Cucurbita pepo subsp. pepo]
MASNNPPTLLLLLLFSAISATLITQVFTFFIDFPLATNYDQLATLIWTYDTSVFHGQNVRPPLPSEVQSIPNASVRVVYNETFLLRNRDKAATFIANFVLNLGSEANSSPAGNEGVAFILTPELAPPAGSEGQWLGIANSKTNGMAEARIFAIEFDTKKNFPGDVDGNHVGLDLNGVESVLQVPLSGIGVNLSGTADVFVRVDFDGENISVFVSYSSRLEDQLKSRVIFHPLNLSFLPDEVYVGFSASKFDYSSQLNWIKSWQFSGDDVGDVESNNHRRWVSIGVGVGVSGVVLLLGVGFLWFWIMKKRRRDLEEANDGIEDQLQDFSIAPRVQKFRFRELKKATDNFDPKNRLGRGGFGTVYKGNLTNREVAVKRISEDSRQGKQEFITEVATIGGLHHKNLVKLIGWCYEKRDFLLVYEYMPNGSLDKLIFGGGGGDSGYVDNRFSTGPNWEIRLSIIYGVAEALDYLHNGCEKTVLHRDVKSSNIMLDSKFEPKLGDFGLARTIRRTEQTHHSTREIAGTRGYMAPEIFLTSRATVETDVYAFGVLVLEVACGRKAANPSEIGGNYDGDITHWVWEFQERGEIVKAADERMAGQYEKEEMERILVLGLGCCHPNPHQRPTMKNVLQVLTGEMNPPTLPHEKPTFMWPAMAPSSRDDTDSSVRETQFADQLTELVGR